LVSVHLGNDDFAYYYEMLKTEAPVYFMYSYSSEPVPPSGNRLLYNAAFLASDEPLGEGTPDVSRALLALESAPQSGRDREMLRSRLESLLRAAGGPQESTDTRMSKGENTAQEQQEPSQRRSWWRTFFFGG
jgi:hypothetical protein